MGSRRSYSISDLELIEKLAQAESRKSIWAYRQYLDPKLKIGWWQREIAMELQRFWREYRAGLRPYLVIQAPPQHGKSTQVIDAISWMAGQDPSTKFIYASFSERLGVRANLRMQRTIDSAKYAGTFEKTQLANSLNSRRGQYQRNHEMIEFVGSTGYFRNTTVRGSVTGESLDIGIIDDPIKGRLEANSETVRDSTWDWMMDDFFTRFSDSGAFLSILTRWHVDDPIGRLIAAKSDVRVLSYPAIATQNEKHRKEGEALFQEHKSLEFLLSRKATMANPNWLALYQQSPIVFGGEMFKDHWWQYYDIIPPLLYRVIYADTAQKTKTQNDYTVFQHWGFTADGRAYLLEQLRGKWEAPELLTRARAFWNKCKAMELGALRAFKIEDKVSGTGLIQSLRREAITVQEISRSSGKTAGDKVTRANDAIPAVESGRVYLPRGAKWLSDYLEELSAFPNGVHDDQVDATVDAIVDGIVTNKIGNYAALVS